MRIWIRYIISSVSSLILSLRHFRKFNLSFKEYIRYVKKSMNLSLCYSSFSGDNKFRSYKKVGEIAFFSSAYDIITDCKKYDPDFKNKYFELLKSKASGDICILTEEMYFKDNKDSFNNDGLERGEISLKIILLYIGSINYFQHRFNISELGEICQITDDIIDYEEDKILNETNCFLSNRRYEYARKYKSYFSNTSSLELFKSSPVMNFIIKDSINKLDKILIDTPLPTKTNISLVPFEL
jgi:hypothetical protein